MAKQSNKVKPGKQAENYLPNNNPMSGIFDLPGIGGLGGIGGGPTGSPWGCGYGPASGRIAPLSEPWEMMYNNSYYLLSLLRVVLTYAYTIHGPLRKVVNTPVHDAFRGGVRIHTDEVSSEELEALHRRLRELKFWIKLSDAMRWCRLYGGGALILNTEQDFREPFNVQSLKQDSTLSFIVADRWQLQWKGIPQLSTSRFIFNPGGYADQNNTLIADIDPSRVFRVVGEEAPAMIRQRLVGWGMSVLEPIIRPMNLYFKEENALFEYIDEFKIDVYKIDGFNSQILNPMAKGVTTKRIMIANWMKNFMNAITLDMKDDYQQKQISFAGVADIMNQIRINIACACDMPMSKLFGLAGGSGFDSGESELETYNAMVMNEREKAEEAMRTPIEAVMMAEWGFIPEDWRPEWTPLRVLSAEQEENVKTSKFNRQSQLYTQGIYNPQEYCEALKEDELLTIDTEVAKGAEPEPPMLGMTEEGEEPSAIGGAKKPSSGKKPKE